MTFPARLQTGLADTGRWLSLNAEEIGLALLTAAGIILVLLALRALGRRWAQAGEERTSDLDAWRAVLGRVLARTRVGFMAAAAAEIVVEVADAPGWLERAVHIVFVIAFAIQAAIWVRELVLGAVESRVARDRDATTLHNAMGIIRLLVTVAAFAIALVLILSNLGVNVTGLVAGLGIGGIAIGLAAQSIFSDLFAALAIVLDRPFRRGDTIRFGNPDVTGTVEGIGLKTTRLRALDGEQVVVSNAKLLDQQIRNLADVGDRRVVLTLPLLNRNDPARLADLPAELRRIVEGEPDTSFTHAWVTGFGAVTTDVELVFRIETHDAERMMEARHRVALAVLARLRALGLQLNGPWPA